MMRVICCHTDLNKAAAAALRKHAPMCELIRLDPDDDYAYWKALAGAWDRGGDLMVIEQDIVVGPTTVPSMQVCAGESDWCAAPYPAYKGYALMNERALGCTRFSARVQAAVGPGQFRAPWRHVADRFIALFDPLYPHRHLPVGHEHPMPAGAAP